MALPNLIIIGAPKCATTSVHRYLETHPQIFMARKELQFFLEGVSWGAWEKGWDWYIEQFQASDAELIRGDNSPGYATYGFTEDVVAKMVPRLPDVKLVYMMRHPLKRVLSHYTQSFYEGHFSRKVTLDDILSAGPNDPGWLGEIYRDLVYTSLYHQQLAHYLKYYPLERFHFITTEALNSKPTETMQALFHFLKVDEDFMPPNLDQQLNQKSEKWLRVVNPTAKLRLLPGYETVSKAFPESLKTLYRKSISYKIDRNKLIGMTDEHQAQLRELFALDVAALRRVTGQAFAEWDL